VIKVEHVSKVFEMQAHQRQDGHAGSFRALDDVSFEIAKGETVGVIGRNGSGKSTLLRILSGLTKPTEGSVSLKGKVASILEIGTGFHSDLTGRENIYFNAQLLGFSKKDVAAKFDEIVAFSGIADFIDEPVKNYSSGMYLRLAFSIIVNIDADILLLDEVMSVGDAEFQIKCNQKLAEIRKQSRTLLFVSHNMNEILRTCTKVILMENGRIKAIGNSQDKITDYMEDSFFGKRESGPVRKPVEQVDSLNVRLPISLPEIDVLRINKIVVNKIEAGKPGEVFVEDELSIEISVTLKSSNLPYSVGLTLKDVSGNYVCSVHSGLQLSEYQAGDYVVKAVLPANLFNTIPLLIDFALLDESNVKGSIMMESLVYVKFSDKLEAGNNFKGMYRGAIRPKSTWSVHTQNAKM